MRGNDAAALTALMRVITTFGSPPLVDVVFVVAVAGLLLAGQRHSAAFLTLASPGSFLLEQLLKHAVDRRRPIGHHLTDAHRASWPSGHASSSRALYGALMLIGVSRQRRHEKLTSGPVAPTVIAVTFVLVALIGVSRVCLGVHFPTDIAASWTLAGAWLTVLYRIVGPSATTTAQRPSRNGSRPSAEHRGHCDVSAMNVEVLYFAGCPNHETLVPHLGSPE